MDVCSAGETAAFACTGAETKGCSALVAAADAGDSPGEAATGTGAAIVGADVGWAAVGSWAVAVATCGSDTVAPWAVDSDTG